ncbi:MAG: sensor histidine kinase [Clostridia bacterium]|nr:sensor histidine kinase [Clostridia bacterium]
MNEFIICLTKYTAIFTCFLYAYTKLLRIKLKVWDLFDIPIFIVLSTVLYFVTVYMKMLVPIGFLIFGSTFLYLRFRKTFYETVKVGTIALGLSIVVLLLSFFIAMPIAVIFNFINNDNLKIILAQLLNSVIQIAGTFLIFKIKRLQSGVNPKSENATFEILLFFSVGCIFTMMLLYTKNAEQSIFEIVLLIIALFGLLLILWWFRHITYNYREAVKQQNVNRMEDRIEEYELNSVENDLQVAVYAKLFHYLNKAVPDCALLAESVAVQTGCADACATRDMLHRILREMNIANEKCSLQNIPQTGVRVIDVPVIRLFTLAERKNFNVSAGIFADVESWFKESKLRKEDIHILLSYLCDNAMISALGSPNAKVRVELGATASENPLIRIYDSGEQFDEEVLAKLGLEQVTTRAGVGGSGIGLFTVFEILAKYGASFTLDEAPQRLGFTKFIEIAFDGRRSVTVRTLRESVVAVCATRKGITVEHIVSDGEALRDGTNG